MRVQRIVLWSTITVSMLSAVIGRADLMFSFNNPSFLQNSGIQDVELKALSTSGDNIIALAADFELVSGSFDSPAGSFGGVGQIGSGNLNIVSSFVRDGMNVQRGYLSLDFNAAQLFPNVAQSLAKLKIDVTGLGPGTYPINFLAPPSALDLSNDVPTSFQAGSFTIYNVVPEPSSLLHLVVLGLLASSHRDRWRSVVHRA